MPAAPSMGYAAHLGMDASSTASEEYEFVSEGLAAERTILNTAGMRGSRSEVIERIRQGTSSPGGPIVLEPTPTELRKLLPRIMGGAEVNNTTYYSYTLADTLPSFQTVIDRVAKVFTYNTCAVDKATFRARAGQILQVQLDVEALSETIGAAGTFPSLTIDATAPFTIFDGVLTLGGAAIQMMECELIIDNLLKKDRFVNSQTRTNLPPQGRKVTLRCTVPYTSDTISLYDTGATGVTSDLKFAVGGAGDGASGTSLHFLLQNVCFPARKSPVVPNKDEITMLLEGQVYKTGSSAEFTAKIDVTA